VESGADYDIDDVYELVAIVDRLNARHPPEAGRSRGRGAARPAAAGGVVTTGLPAHTSPPGPRAGSGPGRTSGGYPGGYPPGAPGSEDSSEQEDE
jgi:hypothetical protein